MDILFCDIYQYLTNAKSFDLRNGQKAQLRTMGLQEETSELEKQGIRRLLAVPIDETRDLHEQVVDKADLVLLHPPVTDFDLSHSI